MNTIAAIVAIIVIVVVVGAAYYFVTGGSGTTPTSSTSTPGTTTSSGASNGKVVYTMSDAAASAVSSVNVQVRSVQMQSAATGQWYTAAAASQSTYQLHGQSSYSLVGNVTVPAGNYDAVRMNLSSVTATYVNGTTQAVVVPNSTIMMKGTFPVQATASGSSTNWITFNINAIQSLHTSSNGRFVIYPAVEVIAWSGAQLTTGANSTMSVQNYGQTTADVKAGMNLTGLMQANFVLSQTTNIVIGANGTISVGIG